MSEEKLRYSSMKEGKEYKANCPYWFNAVFFKTDGQLTYRLDNSHVYKTTYDMHPGLNNCTFSEHIEPVEEVVIDEPVEEQFTFLDDYIDNELKKYDALILEHKHDVNWNQPTIYEYLKMSTAQWERYILDRVSRHSDE